MIDNKECSLFNEKTISFIEGKLTSDEFNICRAHLRTCECCTAKLLSVIESEPGLEISPQTQKIVEYYQKTLEFIEQEEEIEPLADSWQQLQRTIKKEEKQARSRRPRWMFRQAFSFSIITVCIALLTYNYVFRFPGKKPLQDEFSLQSQPINNVYFDGLLTIRSGEKTYNLKTGEFNILHIKPYDIELRTVPFELREINEQNEQENIPIWNDVLRKDMAYEYWEVVIPVHVLNKMEPTKKYRLFYPQAPTSSPQFHLQLQKNSDIQRGSPTLEVVTFSSSLQMRILNRCPSRLYNYAHSGTILRLRCDHSTRKGALYGIDRILRQGPGSRYPGKTEGPGSSYVDQQKN